MSSEDLAIKVENVSMQFEMYARPSDQLKQYLLPRLQRSVGLLPRQYFQPFVALDNISFEVKKGESVGIIGRNGSGKSTLLQIITGTLSPTSGQVRTHGRIAALLELGSGFNPEFTGRENVYLNGALLGLSREQIDARFDAIAAFADIGSHLDQPVKTYSSGMLVRLAFAVQVQVEPDILIVDEALAVGDALFQKRCFQQLEKLVSNGTSLLFVSHDQEIVRTITNRAILIHKGSVISSGASATVVRDYRKLLHKTEQLQIDSNLKFISKPTALSPEVTATKDNLNFGDLDGQIQSLELLNDTNTNLDYFRPRDRIKFIVKFFFAKDLTGINVGLMIRNKEGVKIYAWGTLNSDTAGQSEYWNKIYKKDTLYTIEFIADCALGENLYEVQAALMQYDIPDYNLGSSRIISWQDEAAFFRVIQDRELNFFGGVCDLRMQANEVPV